MLDGCRQTGSQRAELRLQVPAKVTADQRDKAAWIEIAGAARNPLVPG